MSFDFGQLQVLPQLPGLVTGHVRPHDARGGPHHVAVVEGGSLLVLRVPIGNTRSSRQPQEALR